MFDTAHHGPMGFGWNGLHNRNECGSRTYKAYLEYSQENIYRRLTRSRVNNDESIREDKALDFGPYSYMISSVPVEGKV